MESMIRDDQDAIDKGIPYNIFCKENSAIVMAYFSVGLVTSILKTPLNVYLVDVLDAEPHMQNTISIFHSLPWTFKLIFGFLSDAFPIAGMHRKPYFVIGSLLYSCAFMTYGLIGKHSVVLLSVCIFVGTLGLIQMDVMADTMCVQRSKLEPEEQKGGMQSSCYSIRFAGSFIGSIIGASICNTKEWGWGLNFFEISFIVGLIPFLLVTPMLYSLKEKYHKAIHPPDELLELGMITNKHPHDYRIHHPHHHHSDSEHQSLLHNDTTTRTYQSISLLPPSSTTTSYTSATAASSCTTTTSTIPTTTTSTTSADDEHESLLEKSGLDNNEIVIDEETQSIYSQLLEIWDTVQLTSVWKPMAFVYIYNLLQVPNVAWQSYLQLNLEFPAWMLGMTVILGSFMTFAGIVAYKFFFFKTSWRNIYLCTTCFTFFFSLLQLLLIFQLNQRYLHLNNYLFSLGDDVIGQYISGIQFLPLCIMYMRLCPEGAEGTSYAMLTTFGDIALICANNVGSMVSRIWDVSNTALRNKDIHGLWKLTLLTSLLALIPLTLLSLLPRDAKEQDELAKSKEKSPLAGVLFLCVLGGSVLWTFATAIYTLVGW